MFKPWYMVVITPPKRQFDGPGFMPEMERFVGSALRLAERQGIYHEDDGGWWRIEEDRGEFFWAGNRMKKVNKFKGNK